MENEVQDKNRYEVQWVTDRSQFMKGLVWHTKDLEGLPTAVFPKVSSGDHLQTWRAC